MFMIGLIFLLILWLVFWSITLTIVVFDLGQLFLIDFNCRELGHKLVCGHDHTLRITQDIHNISFNELKKGKCSCTS